MRATLGWEAQRLRRWKLGCVGEAGEAGGVVAWWRGGVVA